MNIEEFVREALTEIRAAAAQSDSSIVNKGLHVYDYTRADQPTITDVEFDIAVEATSESSSSGGGGLKVATGLFNAGGEGEKGSKTSESNLSRVRFKIPLILPKAVGGRFSAE